MGSGRLTWMLLYQWLSRDGNVNNVVDFLDLATGTEFWYNFQCIAYYLDTTGLTEDLFWGSIIEFINWCAYNTYYVFDVKLPNLEEFFEGWADIEDHYIRMEKFKKEEAEKAAERKKEMLLVEQSEEGEVN